MDFRKHTIGPWWGGPWACISLYSALLGLLPAQNAPFRVQTKVVQVPVRVTDKEGRNIDGLRAKDFDVRDDGVRQEITADDFFTGLAPISLVIAVQTAGISTPALTKIRRIGGMIQPLVTGARGEVAVLTFDRDVKWAQDFTRDDAKIAQAVKSLKVGSAMQRARLLDAIAEAAGRMKDRKGRKMLLLISESRDRGSETPFEQAVEAVERQGIEVFGAHYSAYATTLIAKPEDLPDVTAPPTTPINPAEPLYSTGSVDLLGMLVELGRLAKTNTIDALTRATGGSDYPFLKERGIEDAIQKLGAEVHSQYILSFPQRDNAPGLHQIQVSVQGRGDLKIRARSSYWAE